MSEVLAGEVQTQFSNFPTQLQNIKTGKVNAIAITALKRHERLPEVPTFDDFYKSEIARWMKVARDAGIRPE